MSANLTLEIQLAPNVEALLEKLLVALSPKTVVYSQQIPPQSPAEQAARMRMQQAPTPMPQQPAPTYAQQQQYHPQPGPVPAGPYMVNHAPAVPTVPPAAPIRNLQPAPVNPTQAAPMPNNRTTGAANMVPVAGPAPSQPAPIVPSTNPMPAGPSTAQPAAYPSNPAPVTAAPAYEQDQLARAMATLADAGKMQQIQQLFQQFQIQQMDQLPKERYGEFATALRGLGVRI